MYVPPSFRIENLDVTVPFMRRFNFASLVTALDGALQATHVPILIDRAAPPSARVSLLGHFARANPQWQSFDGQTEALVIFSGPHAYVSPTWYEDPGVPTWNYTAVHAHGIPRCVADPDAVRDILRRLADQHEAGRPQPWTMDIPEPEMVKLQQAIVAFEIPITRLECAFKLSQNQSPANLANVARQLASSADPLDREIAAMMRDGRGA